MNAQTFDIAIIGAGVIGCAVARELSRHELSTILLEANSDLGAESIDFLDIVFRLEKNFDIRIPRGELFPENLASAESGFVQNGVVTESGIAELKQRMPHADVASFAADPKVENIQDLFTVGMICKFLEAKLAKG